MVCLELRGFSIDPASRNSSGLDALRWLFVAAEPWLIRAPVLFRSLSTSER